MKTGLAVMMPTLGFLMAAALHVAALPTLNTTATTQASNLALDGIGSASEHILKVADLTLSTDNPNGYTLTISSGTLSNSEGETPVAFQVTTVVDGASVPGSSAFTTPSGNNYTVSTTTAGQANQDLYIKYTPAALQDPGTYTGSISLVVMDN